MELFNKKRLIQAMMIATAASLAACGSDNNHHDKVADHTTATYGSDLTFSGVNAPKTDAEKRQILVSDAVLSDTTFGGEYNTLARSGTDYNGIIFGQLVDENGTVLQEGDGAVRVSNSNEHTSLLEIGDKLFSVSQMESTPGAMFLMELNQDSKTGALSVKHMSQIDQSGVNGGWVHCAASVTPWQSHLASEEYEPDARSNGTVADFKTNTSYYAGQLDYYTEENHWNPYFYGWNIEVAVSEDATTNLSKHYSMGRLAFELAKVLPDSKTAYMTDDGTNVGFYMYVADKAGDLTAGTVYALKWNQTSAEGLGAANISWVNLGHSTDAEIKAYVDNGTTFDDIFSTATATNGVCPEGFTSINANGKKQECLAIKEGMDKAASRLEMRRYAAMHGATTEFRKEEGITYDSKRNKLYVGMSEVWRGMQDFAKGASASDSYDLGGNNDIRLDSWNECGGVYQLNLASNVKDTNGTAINSDFVVTTMSGLIAGRPVTASMGSADLVEEQAADFQNTQMWDDEFVTANTCHIDGLANPDNVTYMSGYDKLIIGEDTGTGHQNDVIWAYDFDTASLTRIQTTPYGSETTSPYWYPNINGWAYLMSVVQHPYGESDGNQDTKSGENYAYTGYIGPFPGIKDDE